MARGYEDRDGLADHFIGRVAKNALRPLVPARDDALESLADDRVIGRFNQGGEPVRRQFRTLKISELIFIYLVRPGRGTFFRHTLQNSHACRRRVLKGVRRGEGIIAGKSEVGVLSLI